MEKKTVDVCVSFDTTGSMYPCLTQVRREVNNLVADLWDRVPGIRIAIVAHGDYCDAGSSYVYKALDFTSDKKTLHSFINNVGSTHGGDAPECYELVLHEIQSLSWKGDTRAFVMIGDDVPHEPSYRQNTKRLDWKEEVAKLLDMNVRIYGVHAMPGCRRHSKSFYEAIASRTNGFYISLDQFNEINDILIGICAHEESKETLEEFIASKRSGVFSANTKRNFDRLLGKKVDVSRDAYYTPKTAPGELSPVPSGRFQVIHVDVDSEIRSFVQEQGIEFKKGRGFYELTKAVKVQQYKEIILQDKVTGDFFNGSQVREMLGLASQTASGGTTESLHKKYLDKYKVFIQSTSVNRKLIGGTDMLYEVPDWEK